MDPNILTALILHLTFYFDVHIQFFMLTLNEITKETRLNISFYRKKSNLMHEALDIFRFD
jgi:hypothetical protein